MTTTSPAEDRRQQLSDQRDTSAIQIGDVFTRSKFNDTAVVVERLERYVRVVDPKRPRNSARLWRETYVASPKCELDTERTPDNETVEAWKKTRL